MSTAPGDDRRRSHARRGAPRRPAPDAFACENVTDGRGRRRKIFVRERANAGLDRRGTIGLCGRSEAECVGGGRMGEEAMFVLKCEIGEGGRLMEEWGFYVYLGFRSMRMVM